MKSEKNYGGLWMLFGLVVMLTIPMAVGYYTISPTPSITLHADASVIH